MSLYICPGPRVSPKVNYRLQVIMICQYRFITCNKCTTPRVNVDNGVVCMFVGRGYM